MKNINLDTVIFEERISYSVYYGNDESFNGDEIVDDKVFCIENIKDETYAKGIATGILYSSVYKFAYVIKNTYNVDETGNYVCTDSTMIYEIYPRSASNEFTDDDDDIDPKNFS